MVADLVHVSTREAYPKRLGKPTAVVAEGTVTCTYTCVPRVYRVCRFWWLVSPSI